MSYDSFQTFPGGPTKQDRYLTTTPPPTNLLLRMHSKSKSSGGKRPSLVSTSDRPVRQSPLAYLSQLIFCCLIVSILIVPSAAKAGEPPARSTSDSTPTVSSTASQGGTNSASGVSSKITQATPPESGPPYYPTTCPNPQEDEWKFYTHYEACKWNYLKITKYNGLVPVADRYFTMWWVFDGARNNRDIKVRVGYIWDERGTMPQFTMQTFFSCNFGCYVRPEDAQRVRVVSRLKQSQEVHSLATSTIQNGERRLAQVHVAALGTSPPEGGSPAWAPNADATMRCTKLSYLYKGAPGCVVDDDLVIRTYPKNINPQITQHVEDALDEGRPYVLHRKFWGKQPNLNTREKNRLCRAAGISNDCDEYPMASTREGCFFQKPCNIKHVEPKQNRSDGGLLAAFYNQNRVADGDVFYIHIAGESFPPRLAQFVKMRGPNR